MSKKYLNNVRKYKSNLYPEFKEIKKKYPDIFTIKESYVKLPPINNSYIKTTQSERGERNLINNSDSNKSLQVGQD